MFYTQNYSYHFNHAFCFLSTKFEFLNYTNMLWNILYNCMMTYILYNLMMTWNCDSHEQQLNLEGIFTGKRKYERTNNDITTLPDIKACPRLVALNSNEVPSQGAKNWLACQVKNYKRTRSHRKVTIVLFLFTIKSEVLRTWLAGFKRVTKSRRV